MISDNGGVKLDGLDGLMDLEANIAASDLMKDIDSLDMEVCIL